jgi:endonuclease/exonuclease/phosphatase family metal-dependent hydrolase
MPLTKFPKPENSVRLLSFNILSDSFKSKESLLWKKRKEFFIFKFIHRNVANLILHYSPEIFGLQDCSTKQIQELDEIFTKSGANFKHVTQSAYFDEKKQTPYGENCPIFYNSQHFEVVESGTFWLTEDAEIVGSKSWDAVSSRICTWAKFLDKTKPKEEALETQFLVYNTHWDQGRESRRNGSWILRTAIESKLEEDELSLVIILGDFNCTMKSNDLSILLKKHDGVFFQVMPDCQDSEEEEEEPLEFHFAQNLCVNEDRVFTQDSSLVFGKVKETTDFILVSEKIVVKQYAISVEEMVSTHRPIISDLVIV